jgi:hypothetical protein
MEKRADTRIYCSLPMECEVHRPDPQQSWESRALLKNISQTGLYFECETAPQLKRGDVAEFIFATTPAKCGFINSPIKTQAVIKRLTHRVAGTFKFGVAVMFLSVPRFG